MPRSSRGSSPVTSRNSASSVCASRRRFSGVTPARNSCRSMCRSWHGGSTGGRHRFAVVRRIALAVAAILTIAAGLAVHAFAPDGFWSDAAGDALYAGLIYLLVAFVLVRAPWLAAALALAWCV